MILLFISFLDNYLVTFQYMYNPDFLIIYINPLNLDGFELNKTSNSTLTATGSYDKMTLMNHIYGTNMKTEPNRPKTQSMTYKANK